MPKGRNKGFQYYMCKKFFHPSNPQNLERVFIAKQRQEERKKRESEKQAEYEKEQERWRNKHTLSKVDDREKMQLSFMYDPPANCRKDKTESDGGETSGVQGKQDNFKFDWQRKAPRESYAKDDPNITDHPFGIQVQFTKCMRCQVWGHSHTDRNCPRFGKAKDHEEPVRHVDQKRLLDGMRSQGLRFTSYGAWDNGKTGKHYDLVYSSSEETEDVLVNLVTKIRKKKHKLREREQCSRSEVKITRRKNRLGKEHQHKQNILSKVDDILASEIKSEVKTFNSIADVKYTDIANSEHSNKKSFLDEVDKILSVDPSEPVDTDQDESNSDSSSDAEKECCDDLTEFEMRLLNLINIRKIDMKMNFPSSYPDILCHFCRQEETSDHLVVCPVYDKIMKGTEFEDIKSNKIFKVKKALANILAALLQRSKALAVTSVGDISKRNMRLLLISKEKRNTSSAKEKRAKMIDEILALS